MGCRSGEGEEEEEAVLLDGLCCRSVLCYTINGGEDGAVFLRVVSSGGGDLVTVGVVVDVLSG